MPNASANRTSTARLSVDVAAMRKSAGHATAFLRAMANEDRLLLLCQLTEGERCVTELEALTGIVQPTLSQQLSVLRAESLVTKRREGKYIYYGLQDARIPRMLAALQALFCNAKRSRQKELS